METSSDVETIEHLDFEPSILCDPRHEPCEKEAVYILRCLHCPRWRPICEDHRRYIEYRVQLQNGVQCSGCETTSTVMSDVMVFEPIKAAS